MFDDFSFYILTDSIHMKAVIIILSDPKAGSEEALG